MTCRLSGGRDTSVASALIGENGFLLRDVEVSSGAGFQPLLDGIKNPRRARDIALGGTKPVLRGKHLKIGSGDAGEGGQRNDIAIEAGGDGGFLRRLQGIAVLAPKIEFIAGAE